MPSADRTIKVGQSWVMRAYLVAFVLVWVVILFAFTTELAADKSPVVVLPTALLIIVISIGVRALRVGAVGDADRLVVRNYFATLKLPRRQIREFAPSTPGRPAVVGTTVQAVMRDGSGHTIDLFTRPLVTPGAREQFQRSLDQLNVWLRH